MFDAKSQDPALDPSLAADLSKVKKGTVDLSREAVEQRAREAKLRRAGENARARIRAFKGLVGYRGRRWAIARSLADEGLIDEREVPR